MKKAILALSLFAVAIPAANAGVIRLAARGVRKSAKVSYHVAKRVPHGAKKVARVSGKVLY